MSPSDYEGLHARYARLLHGVDMSLASQSREDLLQRLRSLFVPMMRTLHENGGAQFSVQVLADPAVQEFIGAHADVLDSGFERTSMSDAMRRRLQRSDYIFSGMKTFHELNEAFPSLIDENGNRKPFEQFLNEVRSIDQTYNEHYLRAEYNFIQSSAEMASKWERFMEDGDRYNLQYRTAKDDKVRPEHAALEGVTLPPSDPFWEEYYPPNGWNCRCTVVQVRKSKYPATSHDDAMALGAEALQKDTKGIFHFNPGLEQKTMPDYNPYTIRRCRDCDIAKGKIDLAKVFIPDYQLCAGCRMIHECYQNREKANSANLPKYTKEEKHAIYSRPISEQFSPTEHKGVTRHILKHEEAMDYQRVLRSASLYATESDVMMLPEIHASELDIRARLGLPPKSNPDLYLDGRLIDIKSPFNVQNIVRNANTASAQGAIACITDDFCTINIEDLDGYARHILRNVAYTQPEVHFIVKGKLYKYNSHGIIHG